MDNFPDWYSDLSLSCRYQYSYADTEGDFYNAVSKLVSTYYASKVIQTRIKTKKPCRQRAARLFDNVFLFSNEV